MSSRPRRSAAWRRACAWCAGDAASALTSRRSSRSGALAARSRCPSTHAISEILTIRWNGLIHSHDRAAACCVVFLRDGRWVIISIVPLPHPNVPHAIVLIHLNEDGQFLSLDPGEPLHAQPRAFSEDELVAQWTGELIV